MARFLMSAMFLGLSLGLAPTPASAQDWDVSCEDSEEYTIDLPTDDVCFEAGGLQGKWHKISVFYVERNRVGKFECVEKIVKVADYADCVLDLKSPKL